MSIESQDVATIAKLSALNVAPEQMPKVASQLNQVLAVLETLQTVDTDQVAPMAHPLDQVQRLRDDVVTEEDQHQRYQKLAPATEQGLYLVPQVIEQT